tara:strand:+ start:8504 stop:8656 length:153 start_codon:yes stop_codon:yes gene_type:complete
MNILFWYIILIAATTSYIALSKKYNPYKWFVIGGLTGIIGLIIILIEPKK